MNRPHVLESRKIYTISEVTRDLKTLLEDSFPTLWLSGEISNFKSSAAGHLYFTLKDKGAQMDAVMFRGQAFKLKFELEDGLQVLAHGKISVYEPRGRYQIILDHLEPEGLGALQLAFEQLKKKLEAEGLFDPAHKKPIPFLPRRVGLVTSPQGAVLHDMITVLHRRFPNMPILVHPVRVQGEGAASEIADAIRVMNEFEDVDVLLVGRGGGSLEDLWAFNEEEVVRAIFSSRIPVISAVGHETDVTLADFVADLRAPTPSAAAELAVPEKRDLLAVVEQHRSLLLYGIRHRLDAWHEKIISLKKLLKDPRSILADWRLSVDELLRRLLQAQKNLLLAKRHQYRELYLRLPDMKPRFREWRLQLVNVTQRLKDLSPLEPLKRGFALVMNEKGETIRSMRDVAAGDSLSIRIQDGAIRVKVVEA